MKITAGTNVLLRAAVGDDPEQERRAIEAPNAAEIVAVMLPALFEFAGVPARGYPRSRPEIAEPSVGSSTARKCGRIALPRKRG